MALFGDDDVGGGVGIKFEMGGEHDSTGGTGIGTSMGWYSRTFTDTSSTVPNKAGLVFYTFDGTGKHVPRRDACELTIYLATWA